MVALNSMAVTRQEEVIKLRMCVGVQSFSFVSRTKTARLPTHPTRGSFKK